MHYKSTWAQVLAPLPIPAFCLCLPWEAAVDGSRCLVSAIGRTELRSSLQASDGHCEHLESEPADESSLSLLADYHLLNQCFLRNLVAY